MSNKFYDYNAKMCQSAHGMMNFADFFAQRLCGNWQVVTTTQDVHDAFEFKRNAAKRDIESCYGLSDRQKAYYCQVVDRQTNIQESFAQYLLWGMNRLV